MKKQIYVFIAIFCLCAVATNTSAGGNGGGGSIAVSDSDASAAAEATAAGGDGGDALGIGIGQGGNAGAGASASGGDSKSEASVEIGDTKLELNLKQTYEATKIPRNFPETQQALRPSFFSGNHSGPYEKGWNASSVPWIYKTKWTAKDIARMSKDNDMEGKMKVYPYQEPFAGKPNFFKVVFQKTTPEEIQNKYTVIAKIIVHADEEKGVDYDSLFMMAGKENLKKIGAPILLVETFGYTLGSSVSGWNIGLGTNIAAVGDGTGVGGSVGGGPGYGNVKSSAITHPFITFLAVAQKGYIPPDPPKESDDEF